MAMPSMLPTNRTVVSLLSASLLLVTSAAAIQNSRTAVQIPALTADQLEFLSHVSMLDLPDGQGGFVRTARISGLNVQVVNGSGTTEGTPDGLGNLIVGYNELKGFRDDRTGSHNLVTGNRHNYTSYGGLVAGRENEINGSFSSISGGIFNTTYGSNSSVSGGRSNKTNGTQSSVSGGQSNIASGLFSSVSGGLNNTASGVNSWLSGGNGNEASGGQSAVSGGRLNKASGNTSSVSGGYRNDSRAYYSSISGGLRNIASGYCSSVSGGQLRAAPSYANWAAGSLSESN